MDQEILELFEKGAIQKSEPAQEEFLNHFVLVQKKDWGKPSGGKSEKNLYIAYEHSKMEDLHCLKFLLKQNDFLYNIGLKDAYFVISLCKWSSKYVRFKWLANLYEFLCRCFGLGPPSFY